MGSSEHAEQTAIGWIEVHADEASDLATAAAQPHGAAEEHDVGNRRHRRHRHVRPQLDLAVVVGEVDIVERTRHRLRPELAVGTEDDAPNLEAGRLVLESRQPSDATAVLANVRSKQQLHRDPPFLLRDRHHAHAYASTRGSAPALTTPLAPTTIAPFDPWVHAPVTRILWPRATSA